MKKSLFLITAFLFSFLLSNAQTEKGTQNLGINLGASYSSAHDFNINVNDNSTYSLNTKISSFNIGPIYSYFIADKLDVGITLSYNNSTYTNSSDNPSSFSLQRSSYYNYGGNIFIRKYYMYKSKIGLRTGAFVGYSSRHSTNTYTPSYSINNDKSITDDYSAALKLDLVYYPAYRLGVAATLANFQYDHFKSNSNTQGHGNRDDLNMNFINNGLSLSVFYVVGTKK